MALGFFILLAAMALAGSLGGFANYVAAEVDPPKAGKGRRLASSLLQSFIAAFATPLFLSLAQSNLVVQIIADGKTPEVFGGSVLIFFGIALIAAFSSRIFLQNITEKLLALDKKVETLTDKAEGLKEGQQEIVETIGSTAEEEVLTAAKAKAESVPGMAVLEGGPLGPREVRLMETLAKNVGFWRFPSTLGRQSGIREAEAAQSLERLSDIGFVEYKISTVSEKKLFKLTARGIVYSSKMGFVLEGRETEIKRAASPPRVIPKPSPKPPKPKGPSAD